MNWRRAALAGGAGAAGASIVYALMVTVSRLDLIGVTGPGPLPFTSPDITRVIIILVLQILVLVSLYLIVLGVGGALPLRTLGVGWMRSFVCVAIAHVMAYPAAAAISLLLDQLFSVQRAENAALTFALGAALSLLLAFRTFSWPLAGATIVVAVASFLAASTFTGYVGLVAWVLLPAVFGLAQRG